MHLAPSPPPLIPEVFERALALTVFSLPSLQRKIKCITFPFACLMTGEKCCFSRGLRACVCNTDRGRMWQQPPLPEAGGGTARGGQTPGEASVGAPDRADGAERPGTPRSVAAPGSRARRSAAQRLWPGTRLAPCLCGCRVWFGVLLLLLLVVV